jgi:hypothetical protein
VRSRTLPPAGAPEGPPARATDVSGGALALDAMQQRLFVVALELRDLRATAADDGVGAVLVRLEGEIDGLIRDVRARALSISEDD